VHGFSSPFGRSGCLATWGGDRPGSGAVAGLPLTLGAWRGQVQRVCRRVQRVKRSRDFIAAIISSRA
jgi:hypothetical protein